MSTTTTTIAGISMTLNFCKKQSKEPTRSAYISREPLANIYTTEVKGMYTVNILTYIPSKNLLPIPEEDLTSGLLLNKDKTLFLSYNGVSDVKTTIDRPDNSGLVLCRSFGVEFDCEDKIVEEFDLYHIQFTYKLLSNSFQSVEAILVQNINEDPETDRGTVTTPVNGQG